MSDTTALYRRIRRRETRSSRSSLAIVLAVLVILGCVWAIVELVLAAIGQPALFVTIPDVARALVVLPTLPSSILIAVGAAGGILGIALVIAALIPGRKARHLVETERSATIVADEVVASAVARHAANAGDIDPDNVRVSVSRRRAIVRMTPASGRTVDRSLVQSVVEEQLESYRLRPTVRARVVVAGAGEVGA